MAEAKKTKKEEVVEEVKEVIETPEQTTTEVTEAKTAKAGKRSEKALKEADEKQAKEERKVAAAEAEDKPKPAQKPARSKLERKGKGYRKSAELVDSKKTYSLKEALDLVTKTSHVKFDATVEVHVNLGVDPRQADQNLRDTIVLPAGTGRTVRVAVFGAPDDIATAKKAGADIAAGEEFLQQLDKGVIDFDILIATPSMMAKLGKYARTLGPKGLMPNPKSGTVTTDVAKAVTEAKAGRLEYRVDSTGIVHVGVGKVSFGADKLNQNVRAVFASIKSNKPASIKSTYVKSVHLTTSMGPSIKVETSEI
jgi:large subunit ribosomal protein L1